MFKSVDYIMVMVSDMKKSVKFYRDTLGLKLKFQSPEWTEFSTGRTTVALHGGAKKKKTKSSGSEHAGQCSFGFYVKDIDATYTKLKKKGVKFEMAPSDSEGEPIRLAVCNDPDGLSISITQTVRG